MITDMCPIGNLFFCPNMCGTAIADLGFGNNNLWILIDHNEAGQERLIFELGDYSIDDIKANIYRVNDKHAIKGKFVYGEDVLKWFRKNGKLLEIEGMYTNAAINGVILRTNCRMKKEYHADIHVWAKSLSYDLIGLLQSEKENQTFVINDMSYLPQVHDAQVLDIDYTESSFGLVLNRYVDDENMEKVKLLFEVVDDPHSDVQAYIYRNNRRLKTKGQKLYCRDFQEWFRENRGIRMEILGIYVAPETNGVFVRASLKRANYVDIHISAKVVSYISI